jgi:hypothetical protein
MNPDLSPAVFVQPPPAGTQPYRMLSAARPAGLGMTGPHSELILWTVGDEASLGNRAVPVAGGGSYFPPSAPARQPCSHRLDVLDHRLRNVVQHGNTMFALQVGSVSPSVQNSYVRVYRLEFVAPPHVADPVTLSPDAGVWYYNPAIAVGPQGNLVATFNRSSAAGGDFASIWTATLPAGATAWDPPQHVKTSVGCYSHDRLEPPVPRFGSGSFRWGESAGASPDPNGSGVWVYNVYAAASKKWGTWLTKVEF